MAHMKGMVIYNMLGGLSNIKPTQESVTQPSWRPAISVAFSFLGFSPGAVKMYSTLFFCSCDTLLIVVMCHMVVGHPLV